MPKKIALFIPVLVLLLAPMASADCTDLTKHYQADNYYPDEDYGPSAHAHAKIDLSRIYGEDCTDNPYKGYAKVRVSCEGYSRAQGPLYLYRLKSNADWSDAKQEINCNKYGCTGEDRAFSSGTHTVTLRDRKGDMDSVFFVCYDYDKSSEGYWAWTWKGYGFMGNRQVFKPRVERKCSNNDLYWYDSLGRKGDKYEDCGSDSCTDWEVVSRSEYQITEERTCYDRGCKDGSCFEEQSTETRTKTVGGESVLEFIKRLVQAILKI